MLKRFNDGLARGEAALAVGMLLFMIFVAFAQALLRNLTNVGMEWANAALEALDWADFIIQKGTLWLAFLGASLAVHADRHIGIDIVPRLAPPKVRKFLQALVGVIGAVLCFYLARAFWAAVLINGEERPAAYEILTMDGGVHVCDATPEQLSESVLAQPGSYCYVRAFFTALGVRVDTPGAAFQLIAPVMFIFMSVRMGLMGIGDFLAFGRGDVDDDDPAPDTLPADDAGAED